jgi:orotate phosphoribosyltransferase
MSTKTEVASALLRIGAVFLRPDEPFTWASGIKSPVYCDNRLILSDVDARETVETALAETVKAAFPDCEILMGTATAGIAHAAIAAHLLRLPTGYVRSGAKDHGRNNRIEGKLEKGAKAVVIEDLISTAGSSVETAEALREAGAEVLGVVSIFTYGMQKGVERLREANLRSVSLTDFDTLVALAAQTGYIAQKDVQRLLHFRDDPADESWMEGKA